VFTPVLSWFTVARIPPLTELCVWLTRTAGGGGLEALVLAIAVRVLV
jgi:hypothetical protein